MTSFDQFTNIRHSFVLLHFFYSVLWHPSGESSEVVTITDSNIVLWDAQAGGSTVQVCEPTISKK